MFSFTIQIDLSKSKLDKLLDDKPFSEGTIEVTHDYKAGIFDIEVECYDEDTEECDLRDDLKSYFGESVKIFY